MRDIFSYAILADAIANISPRSKLEQLQASRLDAEMGPRIAASTDLFYRGFHLMPLRLFEAHSVRSACSIPVFGEKALRVRCAGARCRLADRPKHFVNVAMIEQCDGLQEIVRRDRSDVPKKLRLAAEFF